MRRFRELDGLRGLAAFAVVVGHYTVTYQTRYPGAPDPKFYALWGQYGVPLFFLISGFVILMSARGARRPSDFVISRTTRLYPAYWIALILAIVLGVVFAVPYVPTNPAIFIANLSMVQRWFLIPNVDDVYWTLAVEMQFYVLLFILLLATRNRVTDRVTVWFAAVWTGLSIVITLIVSPVSHNLDPQVVPTWGKILINIPLAEYAPLFCTGMLLYVSRTRGRFHYLALFTAIVAVLNAGLLENWERAAWVAAMIVLFGIVAMREQTRILTVAPLQWLGMISFSLYLTHTLTGFVTIRLLLTYGHLDRDLADAIAVCVALLVAWGVYSVGEKRLSSKARRWLTTLRDKKSPSVLEGETPAGRHE